MKLTPLRLSGHVFPVSILCCVFLSVCSATGAYAAPAERLWSELPSDAVSASASPLDIRSFSELAKRVTPAVVNINVGKRVASAPIGPAERDFFERYFGGVPQEFMNRGLGTGFILHTQGWVLTNFHVVEGADEIRVKLFDESSFPARLVGADPSTDVALLKFEPTKPLVTVVLGNSDALQIGEWVMAIGNPFGLSHTVTVGIVSAMGRSEINPNGKRLISSYIQTDASINPGNSGGPLLNTRGEVIGMNSAVNAAGQGIGFAIPVNMLKHQIPQLQQGRVDRAWLGISLREVTEELATSLQLPSASGALVAEVVPDGPAAKAGLQAGDVIVAFRGIEVHRSADLPWLAAAAGIGEKAETAFFRNGRRLTANITLERMPEPVSGLTGRRLGRFSLANDTVAGTGLRVADITPELVRRLSLPISVGVVVTDVEAGSPAAEAGLRPGDLLLKLATRDIRTRKEFQQSVDIIARGGVISLVVWRNGRSWFVSFRRD